MASSQLRKELVETFHRIRNIVKLVDDCQGTSLEIGVHNIPTTMQLIMSYWNCSMDAFELRRAVSSKSGLVKPHFVLWKLEHALKDQRVFIGELNHFRALLQHYPRDITVTTTTASGDNLANGSRLDLMTVRQRSINHITGETPSLKLAILQTALKALKENAFDQKVSAQKISKNDLNEAEQYIQMLSTLMVSAPLTRFTM